MTFPRPTVIIEPKRGWSVFQLQPIWQYRELLYFLIWRDVKVRYKQTVLGVLWVVIQPLVSLAIFSFLFGGLLNVPAGDAPYALFAYAALLPWNFFSGALTRASISLVGSSHLITKVYFPRLYIPLAGVLSGLVDFAVSFVILVLLMFVFGEAPTIKIVLIPFFLMLAVVTALAFSLWLSALNVRYRDVTHLIPFLIQAWMYVTPVIYGSSLIPERFQFLLMLNPMTAVVEGFRYALLGKQVESMGTMGPMILISCLISLLVLVSGACYFYATERTFADVI